MGRVFQVQVAVTLAQERQKAALLAASFYLGDIPFTTTTSAFEAWLQDAMSANGFRSPEASYQMASAQRSAPFGHSTPRPFAHTVTSPNRLESASSAKTPPILTMGPTSNVTVLPLS